MLPRGSALDAVFFSLAAGSSATPRRVDERDAPVSIVAKDCFWARRQGHLPRGLESALEEVGPLSRRLEVSFRVDL